MFFQNNDGVKLIQDTIESFKNIQHNLSKGIDLSRTKVGEIEEDIKNKQIEISDINKAVKKADAVLKNLTQLLGE